MTSYRSRRCNRRNRPSTRSDLLEAAPTADVVALQQQFHDLCVALLDTDDYQRIGAKDFKKKSAWRKLAAAFNVSDTLLERSYEWKDDGRIRAGRIRRGGEGA